jgi:type I restriction enzyme M protein
LEPKDASLQPKDLLEKYKEEIEDVSTIDKDTVDLFGYCNTWWVFGEVSKEIDYSIFMAEAENVGYKRTKRGPKPMPNELFDIEAAPSLLNTANVQAYFDKIVADLKTNIDDLKKTIETRKNKINEQKEKKNNTDKAEKDLEKEEKILVKLSAEYKSAQEDSQKAKTALGKYYDSDTLKEKYCERTEKTLTDLFTTGIFSQWGSEDVLLRKKEKHKILDYFRQNVLWD